MCFSVSSPEVSYPRAGKSEITSEPSPYLLVPFSYSNLSPSFYRWVINGSIASLWVYALPTKRQTEISVYVARLGALSMWRAWLKHGGWYINNGEILLFAFGWAFLLQLRTGGWKIEGLMKRAIKFVEGKKLEPTPPATPFEPGLGTKSLLHRGKPSSLSIADSGFAEGDSEVESFKV